MSIDKNMVKRFLKPFWGFREAVPSDESEIFFESNLSGLSVFEDVKHLYVEAALPGIEPSEVNISFQKGILSITAKKSEEVLDKEKKYFRKASSNFSYRILLPVKVDTSKEPETRFSNGVLTVTFNKNRKVA